MTTEETKMNGILKAFGRLVCGMTKRHVWTRPKAWAMVDRKICSRCGAFGDIKRRAKVAT